MRKGRNRDKMKFVVGMCVLFTKTTATYGIYYIYVRGITERKRRLRMVNMRCAWVLCTP